MTLKYHSFLSIRWVNFVYYEHYEMSHSNLGLVSAVFYSKVEGLVPSFHSLSRL